MPVGYKVVKIFDDRYYSCSISRTTDTGALEYVIGSTTTPGENNGPMTLFEKKQQAIDWINEWVGDDENARAHYEILRCTYVEDASEQLFFYNTTNPFDRATTHKSKCPTGTRLASSITPTATVRWE